MEEENATYFHFRYLMLLLLGLFFVSSCIESPEKKAVSKSLGMMDDTLIALNKEIVQHESQEIDDFITRYGWKMQTTQTGLRYMIYKNGKGAPVNKGDFVSIRYSVRLLNGDLVFQSDSNAPFKFETGKRAVPSGLEEAVMIMKTGDKAKLIVPPHLAYGLVGDLDKIPNRAILVYDVEICQINQPN